MVHRDGQEVARRCQAEEAAPDQRSADQVERCAGVPARQVEGLGLGRSRRQRGQIDVHEAHAGRGPDHLHRAFLRLGEGGAQGFVAAHDLVEGGFERRAIERALEPGGAGHVVQRAAAGQPVDEPEAPLREGERAKLRRALQERSVLPVLAGPPARSGLQEAGQPLDRRVVEQLAHRHLGTGRGAQPRDHLGRQQRVAAELEEVVAPAHRLDVEDLAEGPGDQRLVGVARRRIGKRGDVRAIGCQGRDRAAIDLPSGRVRQGRGQGDRRGHEGRRQGALEAQAELRRGGRRQAVSEYHQGHQLPPSAPLAAGYRALGHARQGPERGFDLARLHPYASHLELPIPPAQDLQPTVG